MPSFACCSSRNTWAFRPSCSRTWADFSEASLMAGKTMPVAATVFWQSAEARYLTHSHAWSLCLEPA